MIAKIGALLGGKALPWLAGGALLLIASLGAWLRIEQLQRQAAETRIEEARGQLAAAQAALEQRAAVIGALERQAETIAAMQSRLDPIRRVVNAAPRTTACVASPVVAAGLERLRATRPAGADRGAAQPAALPARAGGA